MKNQCVVWFGVSLRTDWYKTWQRDQDDCSWLARDNTVIYIERLNIANPSLLRLVRAIIKRLENLVKGSNMVVKGERLKFIQPVVIPFCFKGIDRLNGFLLGKQILRYLRKAGQTQSLLWISNPSKFALIEMDGLAKHKLVIYECFDRFKYRNDCDVDELNVENELTRVADLIITPSKTIMREKLNINKNTFRIPHYAPMDLISFSEQKAKQSSTMLCCSGAPKICYFGSFHHVFDFEFLCLAARHYPGYRFIIFGPKTLKAQKILKKFSNVELHGFLSQKEAIHRVSQLDVCIIPYIRNEFSKGVFPHKLFVYLASGRPIVASRLPDLEEFDSWVDLAEDHVEFLQLLGEAVEKSRDPKYMHHRAKEIPFLLRKYSQEKMMQEVDQLVDSFLHGGMNAYGNSGGKEGFS